MEIIPAILERTAAGVQSKLDLLAAMAPEVRLVQLDVTDGSITPQVTWHEPGELPHLRWRGEFELHLMQLAPPLQLWLADSRVTRCVVHAEASHPQELLEAAHRAGRLAGLAMDPSTTPLATSAYLEAADYVLLLTVTPGAQGQPFQANVLGKAQQLHEIKPGLPVYVDGGVSDYTIGAIRQAGCAGAVVGSYLWNSQDNGGIAKALKLLRQ